MTDAQWYENMAAAMKRRDHALKMVERWQASVVEAENEVLNLTTNQTSDTPEQSTEQEQVDAVP